MDAVNRLVATTRVRAKEDAAPSEWWHHLPAEQKKEYIEQHPNSKYADQAIKEGEEKGHQASQEHLEEGSEHRKQVANEMRKQSPSIAATLKKSFPKMTHALGALKSLATGKKLEHEQKEVLHELGNLAFHTALGKLDPGSSTIHTVANVGVTAVQHAIDHFKKKKEAAKNKDDVEVFVDALADGAEQAKAAPIPNEHAKQGSSYRQALAKHFKSSSDHVSQVLMKSFPNIKPATQGLASLAKGKEVTPEQRKSIKALGKQGLSLSIAALPGGLPVHLTAGLALAAVNYGTKKMKQYKEQHKDGHAKEHAHGLVHHFIESIGEGLEHALITGHLLGHHEGGEHGGGHELAAE
jgi:hypothetical protein